MKSKILICLIFIFLIGCRANYSNYKEPKKAKHWYTGKKHKDRWMDEKREKIKMY